MGVDSAPGFIVMPRTVSHRPCPAALLGRSRPQPGARPSSKFGRRPLAGRRSSALPELFRSLYFCQREDHALLRSGRAHSRARRPRRCPRGRRVGRRRSSPALFEKRAEGLYHNTAAVIDADGSLARQVSQDAHSRRSALLREVLFHAGRSGFQVFPDAVLQAGRAGLLGPVVSGSGPADGAAGGGDPVLSDGHRLASVRKGRVRRAAASELGADPALARGRERLLRRQRQSHGHEAIRRTGRGSSSGGKVLSPIPAAK